MYKSKTIRRMPPVTRKLAKELNQAERSIIRMGKLISAIQDIEKESLAWQTRQEHYRNNGAKDPINPEELTCPEQSMLNKIPKE